MVELMFTEEIIGREKLLKEQFSRMFEKGDSVAVKLHYGEAGNKTSLKPDYARTIVKALKAIGTKPFTSFF